MKKLEYRGYDSAGVALVGVSGDQPITVLKREGKLRNLEAQMVDFPHSGGTAIAHTRWATHGRPSDRNSHPQCDCDSRIALVHNGIIENYLELKEMLAARGHLFASDTDTEVLAHLIEERYKDRPDDGMEMAVRRALSEVTGAYAVCVVSEWEPGTIYAAKTASPLIIGYGDGENWLASDIPAIMRHTRSVVVLEDGDFARITAGSVELSTLDSRCIEREPFEVTWDVQKAEKGGYPHFMLKEIHEQPQTILDTMRGRITPEETVTLPGDHAFPQTVFELQ